MARRKRRGSSYRLPMTVLILLIGLVVALYRQPAAAPSTTQWPSGTITAVADGDTMTWIDGTETRKLRMHGIDAPEKDQPWGPQSFDFATQTLLHQAVCVQIIEKDRYGREVAEIFLNDGTSFNLLMVENGLAWWYRQYAKDRDDLKAAEARARDKRLGLWRDWEPVPPWEWRQRKRAKSAPVEAEPAR